MKDEPVYLDGKYVNIHTEAHQLLDQAKYSIGDSMDEDTKIQHIKKKFKRMLVLRNFSLQLDLMDRIN